MGDYSWLLLIGVAAVVVMLICAYRYQGDPDACPECDHEQGLNDRRTRCSGVDDGNGLSSHRCVCQNDWHWNYESVQ